MSPVTSGAADLTRVAQLILATDACVRMRFRFPIYDGGKSSVDRVLKDAESIPLGRAEVGAVGSVDLAGPGEVVCGSADLLWP